MVTIKITLNIIQILSVTNMTVANTHFQLFIIEELVKTKILHRGNAAMIFVSSGNGKNFIL